MHIPERVLIVQKNVCDQSCKSSSLKRVFVVQKIALEESCESSSLVGSLRGSRKILEGVLLVQKIALEESCKSSSLRGSRPLEKTWFCPGFPRGSRHIMTYL